MREAASLCVNNMNLSITDMKGGLFVLLIENNNLRRSLNSKPLPHLIFWPMPMFAGLQRRQTMDCSFFNNECNLMWPTLNIYIYIANSQYVYICIYIRIQHTNISSLYPHLHFAPQYVWSVYYYIIFRICRNIYGRNVSIQILRLDKERNHVFINHLG